MFPITVGALLKASCLWVSNMTVSGGDLIAPVVSGMTDAISSLPDTSVQDTVQVVQQTIDNDMLNTIADKLEVTNTLLLGINDRLDFIIALGVAIVFVAVCYSILKSFSRF